MKTFELSFFYRNKEAAVWCLGYNIHTIQSGLKMKGSRRALFQLLIYLAWWQRMRWEGKDFLKVSHNEEVSILRGDDSLSFETSKSIKKNHRSADYWSFSVSLFLETSCFFFFFSTCMGDRLENLWEKLLISS